MMTVLRNRSLLILGAAESVSAIGSWMTMMALYALLVFEGDGGLAVTSGIFLAGMLPTLLLSPAAGWLCDRFDPRRLMIGSYLLSGVTVIGLLFATGLPWIYGLLVVKASFYSLLMPARQASVRSLVAKGDLTRANAFLMQMAGLMKILAPMMAGAVLALVSPRTAMLIDLLSFVAAAAILTLLPPLLPGSGASGTDQSGPRPSLLRTLNEISRSHPLFVPLFGSVFLLLVVVIGFDVTAAVVTRDILQGDQRLFGLLVGLLGLGQVLSAGTLMLWKRKRNPWNDVLIGQVLIGTVPAALAMAPLLGSPALATAVMAVSCFLGGLGSGLLNVQSMTLVQLMSPPGWLGRLGGVVQSVMVGGQLTGMLLTPLLVPHVVSLTMYFGIGTLAILALCSYSMLLIARQTGGNSATNEV